MSNRQLTTALEKDAPLSADIHRLGDLLGATLKRLGGRRLFQTEERVRALCKKLRTRHSPATERQFKQLLSELSLDDAIGVIRAFSVYFQLANIAEQHHRIADLLAAFDVAELAPSQRDALEAQLAAEVESIWQTDEVRQTQPTVMDEVSNGLYYL